MPRHSLQQNISTELKTRLDPRVLVSSRLLQMPQQEFEEAIDRELSENPAFERVAEDTDQDAIAIKRIAKEYSRHDSVEVSHGEDGQTDWLMYVAAPTPLREYALLQLLPAVPTRLEGLARYVVDCLNERGYLDTPPEEIALRTSSDLDDVVKVVHALQQCDPAGIGAFDLQECLDLQLAEFDDRIAIVARAIVRRHWDELVQKKLHGAARTYNLSDVEVEQVLARIRSLNPYPGETYSRSFSRTPTVNLAPDIVFARSDKGVEVIIRGCDPADFAINDWYIQRYRELKRKRKGDPEEKRHIQEFVNRASVFLKGIDFRRRTLLSLASYLLEEQGGFVATGRYEFLRPINRIQIARKLGVHESTISRATLDKNIQLANGEVVPLEVFFKPHLRVIKMIEEILEYENPNSPMSDREIAERLEERGVRLARRTVAKYREQVRLLASHHRRSA